MKQLLRTLIVFTLLAGCQAPPGTDASPVKTDAESATHPYYAQLKAFRTYVIIEKYWPAQHNFWMWYESDDFGTISSFAADTVADAAIAEQLPGGLQSGPIDYPADAPGVEVPSELTAVSDALIARLKELHHHEAIKNIRVRYVGRTFNVAVRELVPQGRLTPGEGIYSHQGSYLYGINETLTRLEPTGSMGSGTEILCPKWLPSACHAEPKLVDFVMPAALEGTSPFAATTYYQDTSLPAYAEVFAQLETKIIATVSSMAAGTYVNPIEAILKAQGDTLLPPSAKQKLAFELSAYLYTPSATSSADNPDFDTETADVTLTLDTEELMNGEVTRSVTFGDTGLSAKVTFNMGHGTISYRASDASGKTVAKDLKITTSHVVTEGPRTYVEGSEKISWQNPDDDEDLHLTLTDLANRPGASALITIGREVSAPSVFSK